MAGPARGCRLLGVERGAAGVVKMIVIALDMCCVEWRRFCVPLLLQNVRGAAVVRTGREDSSLEQNSVRFVGYVLTRRLMKRDRRDE